MLYKSDKKPQITHETFDVLREFNLNNPIYVVDDELKICVYVDDFELEILKFFAIKFIIESQPKAIFIEDIDPLTYIFDVNADHSDVELFYHNLSIIVKNISH